jgi:hypothetical protein
MKYKLTFWHLLCPLLVKIPQNVKDDIWENDDFDLCGADVIEEEYNMYTGRSLFVDTFISAFLWAIIILILIVIISISCYFSN